MKSNEIKPFTQGILLLENKFPTAFKNHLPDEYVAPTEFVFKILS